MRRLTLLLPAMTLAVIAAPASTHAQPPPEPCANGEPNCTSFPGPIGIQTTAPSAALEVADGNIKISRPLGSTAAASLMLHHFAAPNSTGFWRMGSRITGNFGIVNFTGGEILTLLPTGNVGIGTQTPTDKLTVAGAITVGNLRVIDDLGR